MSDSGPPREPVSVLSLAFTAGLTLLAGMFVGYHGGRYLDRLLGSEPWLSLVGTVLGVVAGFRVLLRDILRSGDRSSRRDKRGQRAEDRTDGEDREPADG